MRVTVDDDGPGLPAGDPERLFDKFQRGEGEPAAVGVGLGLAICRAIVRAHGGEITLRTTSRRRRTIRIHLAYDGARRMTQAMHQMLIVEDEPGIRAVLRDIAGSRAVPRRRSGHAPSER